MRAQFCELQFAFGCTRDLEQGTWSIAPFATPTGIPFFPSLVEESELGFDVRFDGAVAPVFIQFKVPEYISRYPSNHWYEAGERPYYRFRVYPKEASKQHNELVKLGEQYGTAYYCSPIFHLRAQYESYHKDRCIPSHSAFINSSFLPRNAGWDEHHIVYTENPDVFHYCSIPTPGPLAIGWQTVVKMCRSEPARFNRLAETIGNLVREVGPVLEPRPRETDGNFLMRQFRSIGDELMRRGAISLGLLRLEDALENRA